MCSIHSAQVIYFERNVGANGKHSYGSLQQLGASNLLDPVLASGTKQGYQFGCQPLEDPSAGFWSIARPVSPGQTGSRYFCASADGVIYVSLKDSNDFDGKINTPPKGWLKLGG